MNNIEIPSIPSLNLISPLIQFFSSTNWKPGKLLSNEYHKKKVKNKLAKEVNSEIYIALLLSLFWLDKNMKVAPRKGRKIIVDKIGKFI